MSADEIELTIGYFSHPPFADIVHDHIEGEFWDLAKQAIPDCLAVAAEPKYRFRRYQNEDQLLHSGLAECNVSFPVTGTPLFGRLHADAAFIPIVSSPGAVWLDPTAGPHQTSMPQLRVIGQAWPLLLIIIVSCSFAAVLVWFMERLRNPQEFPRPFVRGFWEGWWWAFITMTTVGYGDRSPKTICGRLFAMAWISFGLVLISMFTAGVTTALSQGAQTEEDSRFFQTNITVINGSFEQVFVYELGSTPILINDWRSLLQASDMDDGESEARHHGALIEHFMYLHLREEHQGRMRRIKLQYVLKRPSLRGLYSNLGVEVNRCLATTILRHQISVYRRIVGHTHGGAQSVQSPEVAEEVAQSLFSTSNAALGIVAGVFVTIFLALLVWEKVYWKPRNPNYKFVERNWKYDRQKKESEFGRQLDLKSYYRQHSRKCTGDAGGSAATTPTAGHSGGAGGCSMSRPITIETLHAASLDSDAAVGEQGASGNNGSAGSASGINNRRLWCQEPAGRLEEEAEAEAEEATPM